MNSFSTFNAELRQTYFDPDSRPQDFINIVSAENIEKQIRSLVSLEELREQGSFFTPDKLAKKAKSALLTDISTNSIVVDPTCGVGNLLITASKSLPVYDTIDQTLELWGKVLRGFDLVPEFVECTKLRLILEAINRGSFKGKSSLEELENKFQHIETGNVLERPDAIELATHIFMNPPYTKCRAPEDCKWASGTVNSAAIFVDEILRLSNPKTSFSAILPEVLRSGSRYAKWRSEISTNYSINVEIYGLFNKKTDVDVFILSGEKGTSENLQWVMPSQQSTLADKFDIIIGPLVAYRDPEQGPTVPFIFSRMLSPWKTMKRINTTRRTKSKLIKPPFVALKRTSSPSDKNRAVAAIVGGKRSVAVENHIIVLKPKKGGLNLCERLLNVLVHEKTNKFLNQRIRCRHLTVQAVKEIPWI